MREGGIGRDGGKEGRSTSRWLPSMVTLNKKTNKKIMKYNTIKIATGIKQNIHKESYRFLIFYIICYRCSLTVLFCVVLNPHPLKMEVSR